MPAPTMATLTVLVPPLPRLAALASARPSGPATAASAPDAVARAISPRNSRRERRRCASSSAAATRSSASPVEILFRSANQAMLTVREKRWNSGLRDMRVLLHSVDTHRPGGGVEREV